MIDNEDFVSASRTQANLDIGLLDRVLVGRNEPAITIADKAYDTVLAG